MKRHSATLLLMLATLVAACGPAQSNEAGLSLSGFIEGQTYTVASETGGKVEEVLVSQGDQVTAGQPLLRLDSTSLEFGRQAAQAGVDAAQAKLDGLLAQPRVENVAQAQAGVDAAQAALDSAQASLDLLKASYAPFDPPDADLHAAESAVTIAEAGVKVAEAQLEQVKAGPLPGEIEVAQAELDAAQAQLDLVALEIDRLTLTAPVDGVVNQILVREGEIASPGAPLMQVVQTKELTLTVYVPQVQVASISLGDEVSLAVDAYPGEQFSGKVSYIADQAQFTPTNVQTREERVKLVFAVEIRVQDPSGHLKPGMPADASFTP